MSGHPCQKPMDLQLLLDSLFYFTFVYGSWNTGPHMSLARSQPLNYIPILFPQ